MNNKLKIAIMLLCTIEQLAVLTGTVWLIEWREWSSWWMLFALLLVACSSPTQIIRGLESGEK